MRITTFLATLWMLFIWITTNVSAGIETTTIPSYSDTITTNPTNGSLYVATATASTGETFINTQSYQDEHVSNGTVWYNAQCEKERTVSKKILFYVLTLIVIFIVGVTGNPGQGNYAAAKAGMIGMSKSLAAEVASRNITVNCVAPGFIETAMTDKLTDEQKTAIFSRIPAGRMGTGQEIAAATLYLASPEAAYVTGQTLHVNGGMAMI